MELIRDHPESDALTLPTGSTAFRKGEPVRSIHVIEQGLMELSSGPLHRMRFGAGELFFYEDLAGSTDVHSRDATALTPVSLFRLNRTSRLQVLLCRCMCAIDVRPESISNGFADDIPPPHPLHILRSSLLLCLDASRHFFCRYVRGSSWRNLPLRLRWPPGCRTLGATWRLH